MSIISSRLKDIPTNGNYPRLCLQLGDKDNEYGMRVFEAKYIGYIETDDGVKHTAVYPDGVCSFDNRYGNGGFSRVEDAIPFGFRGQLADKWGIIVDDYLKGLADSLVDLWDDTRLPEGAVIVTEDCP